MTAALVFLTFTVCLGPHQCREFNGGEFDTVTECASEAQPAIAQWLTDHPKYRFSGHYTCGPTRAEEGDEI